MNIVLIGMSGAGKSTLGVLLAKTFGMGFVDTDILIQRRAGGLLQEIIDREGVPAFLKMEEETITGLESDNCVIATGGSAVYSQKAMNALGRGGRIIYLHVSYEEIEKRLVNITTRGIVIREGRSLRDVYEERLPLYIRYGDITIDCTDKDIEQCVGEIVSMLRTDRVVHG